MEIAGVALGVAPILVEVIKSWRMICVKINVFRHYSREVKRVFRKVSVQRAIFDTELETLLVNSGIPRSEAQSMLADNSHPRWMDPCGGLVHCLGKDTETFQELIESIAQALQEMQGELKAFDSVVQQMTQTETVKDAVIRLRLRTNIAFKKNEYERQIESLRQDIADLRAIGSYRTHAASQRSPSRAVATQLPHAVRMTRKTIKALHEVLSASWSCQNANHAQHAAKLGLRSQVEEGIRLDLALSCIGKDAVAASAKDDPLWLYVRSLTSSAVDEPSARAGSNANSPQQLPEQTATAAQQRAIGSSQSSTHTGRDLRTCLSLCDSLAQCHCPTHAGECLGFVENSRTPSDRLRLLFYHRCTQQPLKATQAMENSLPAVLQDAQSTLTLEDQLQAAYSVAKSVLELHSTPWLANDWRLNDISLFRTDGSSASEALATMHVTTDFQALQGNAPAGGSSIAPATLQASNSSSLESKNCSDQQCLYGVPNLILFSLGVALLEIGHRRSLENFRTGRDPNNIYTARRLAQRPTLLGQRYQSIAQRCLRCDFGYGSELGEEKLQSAVYADVVSQLGEMLQALRI